MRAPSKTRAEHASAARGLRLQRINLTWVNDIGRDSDYVRVMLDDDFNKRRANLVRELAGHADPFTRTRLLDLVSRYESGPVKKTRPLPPISINSQDHPDYKNGSGLSG